MSTRSTDPPAPPFVVPPLVAYAIAGLTTIVGLFVSQGLLDPRIEKLIVGIAAIVIPLGYLVVNGIVHHANAKVASAALLANAPQPTLRQIP